jgi:hypothetical protein
MHACSFLLCCIVVQAPLVSTGADPAVVVASLRRNMEALNQLSNDRAGVQACTHSCGSTGYCAGCGI